MKKSYGYTPRRRIANSFPQMRDSSTPAPASNDNIQHVGELNKATNKPIPLEIHHEIITQ
jgi:hypothetical protein